MRRHPIYQRLIGSPLYPVLAWPRDQLLISRNAFAEVLHGRRTHAFCPGAPKSGTHSLASLLGGSLRVAHEPHAMMLINALKGSSFHSIPPARCAQLLKRRDRILGLELESSHLLGPFVSTLVPLFPEARFVLPIRDCFSWLDSMINQQLRKRDEAEDRKWATVWDLYFQRDRFRHPPEEQVLKDAGLHTLDGYLTYWSTHNRHVLDTVPTARLFVLRTDQIGSRAGELAAFLGISPSSVDPARSHTYRRSSDDRLLDRLDQEYVADKCDAHCRELMERYYPETRKGRLARPIKARSSPGAPPPSRG
ncbi:MAG: sulfotransferase [Gemmatimonadota bacterium]